MHHLRNQPPPDTSNPKRALQDTPLGAVLHAFTQNWAMQSRRVFVSVDSGEFPPPNSKFESRSLCDGAGGRCKCLSRCVRETYRILEPTRVPKYFRVRPGASLLVRRAGSNPETTFVYVINPNLALQNPVFMRVDSKTTPAPEGQHLGACMFAGGRGLYLTSGGNVLDAEGIGPVLVHANEMLPATKAEHDAFQEVLLRGLKPLPMKPKPLPAKAKAVVKEPVREKFATEPPRSTWKPMPTEVLRRGRALFKKGKLAGSEVLQHTRISCAVLGNTHLNAGSDPAACELCNRIHRQKSEWASELAALALVWSTTDPCDHAVQRKFQDEARRLNALAPSYPDILPVKEPRS